MIKTEFNSITCLIQQNVEITQRPIRGNLYRTRKGVLKFEQTVSTEKCYERNPHLFEGNYVNIGRNKEGEIVLNFRKFKDINNSFDPQSFCYGVYTELMRELPTIVNL